MIGEFLARLARALGLDHPWFRPLPRRIGTCLVCLLWFGLELWGQKPFWMPLSGAAALVTFWALILTYPGDKTDG